MKKFLVFSINRHVKDGNIYYNTHLDAKYYKLTKLYFETKGLNDLGWNLRGNECFLIKESSFLDANRSRAENARFMKQMDKTFNDHRDLFEVLDDN